MSSTRSASGAEAAEAAEAAAEADAVSLVVAPLGPGFPETVQAKAASESASASGGLGVEVAVSKFADRWAVLVTEAPTCKIGSVVAGCKDEKTSSFTVTVLLGDREELWTRVLGRQLAEQCHKRSGKPVLLMCSLKFPDDASDANQAKVQEALRLFDCATAPSPDETDAAAATKPPVPPADRI